MLDVDLLLERLSPARWSASTSGSLSSTFQANVPFIPALMMLCETFKLLRSEVTQSGPKRPWVMESPRQAYAPHCPHSAYARQ